MSLAAFQEEFAISVGDKLFIYNISTCKETIVDLPQVPITNDNKNANKGKRIDGTSDFEQVEISCLSYSENGKYLLSCDTRKQMIIYNRSNWEVMSMRLIARTASQAKFTNDDKIVLMDKSGDVYQYNLQDDEKGGELLLGHLSMLLDFLITDDGKFIVTTDRDEKIRVSMYPNAYNIASFCLGHTKFVTNVSELPHCKDILISAGGDGVLMFWDFKKGKLISSYKLDKDICRVEIEDLNRQLKDLDLEESVDVYPVKHLATLRVDESSSLVFVAYYGSVKMSTYLVTGNLEQLNVEFLNSTQCDSQPIDCSLSSGKLFVLTDDAIAVYSAENNRLNLLKSIDCKNEKFESMRIVNRKNNCFSILYKRKYDNVHEYHEKKKNRLSKNNE